MDWDLYDMDLRQERFKFVALPLKVFIIRRK